MISDGLGIAAPLHLETLHLLSTPANAESLARAIRQDQAGEARPRALLDADGG
ncbi:hypothetical protein [Thiocapsa sp. UBA6158]|jgi:antitoxin YefM|uniref:hypothetical protein n=1 Tax=Thiocapsa sp. UBA6158 TaxID=1947692 RepID=UPI0025ED5BFD|nr:hypothetical protein [Thiocapsa sp. UBA6158]